MAEEPLEPVGPLKEIDEAAFRAIAAKMRVARYPAGSVVIKKGGPPESIFVIKSGRARVADEVDGQRLVLAELGPGRVFGEMSVIENKARSSDVEAARDLELYVIAAKDLDALAAEHPAAAAALFRALLVEVSQRIRHSNQVVAAHFRERIAQFEREQQEKQFMYLLAHDLRSPLAIAEAGLGQLLDRPEKFGELSDAQARILGRSRRSARFLKRLLEELLEVGRSESGRSRDETTTVEEVLLEAIAQSLLTVEGPSLLGVDEGSDFETFRASLARQGLAIEVSAETLHAPLVVDKMRLVQVLMNLVGNALKYAPGAVTVRAAREDGELSVEVVDRGPGMPEEVRATIFERYRQAKAKQEGLPRGFGLGLWGARELVRGLGGKIRAEAGEGGKGTKLAFRIPWREA